MTRDVDRRLLYALLAACIPLLILLLLGIVSPPGPDLVPTPHPDFDPMLSSGSGAPGSGLLIAAGFVTGILVIVMIGICMLIGVRETAKSLRRFVVAGTVVYMLVFCALMLSYLEFSKGGPLEPFETFGGFPVPSAWMLYGIWLFPWVFIIAFVVTFDDVYFPPESDARFRELLRAKERR